MASNPFWKYQGLGKPSPPAGLHTQEPSGRYKSPLTCPVALTLLSSASSLTEESPFPPSPPSHFELQLKSLGVSVVENHWRQKITISAKLKQKAGYYYDGLFSFSKCIWNIYYILAVFFFYHRIPNSLGADNPEED